MTKQQRQETSNPQPVNCHTPLCCGWEDNNNEHWSEGLRFVQLMKNRAFHSGIKRTPYEALFGLPEVDRGCGDARNILAIVMNITDDGLDQLGTKQRVVKSLYSRYQFTVCQK
ncbi:uncharacterized protein LOC111691755 [Anoplophora glabripennis]|uniref:uncharacterized protein LOC111691755 n=1 Tax=Anoplophora glabripennis TaxID=217634 RepID=UPI000C7783C0|nr:uncharacterized protein LOC111691755 [Anoplophora glabripennis]